MFKDNKSIDEISNIMSSYDRGPEKENIYILLTYDMVQKYSAISYLAGEPDSIFMTFCQPNSDKKLVCSNRMSIDTETGELSSQEGSAQLNKIFYTEKGVLSGSQIYSLQQGYTAVLHPAENGFITYILTPKIADSSFAQLFLLQNPDERYFTKVISHYPYGVVYKVNPKDF